MYFVQAYFVAGADAILDTKIGSPPIGTLINQSKTVIIPPNTSSDDNWTQIRINLPELAAATTVASIVIYAYGEGGKFEINTTTSFVCSTIPLEVPRT